MSSSIRYSFYLACSWLWCLGGFFPLILNRDYGWPALVAFTVFNVGGAMAMAFYFKNRHQQHAFARKHKTAITLFSYVTLAYQVFFVVWLSTLIQQEFLIVAVFAIAISMFLAKRYITQIAIGIFIITIGLFVFFAQYKTTSTPIVLNHNWPHTLLPLAIGFILSPYLDITFHRAYDKSDNPKLSFVFGFGVLFLSLILFVFSYAGELSALFFDQSISSTVLYPVFAFLILQVSYTMAAHCVELNRQKIVNISTLSTSLFVFAGLTLALLVATKESYIPWLNIPIPETIYKFFLFFYSLVFPLYLLFIKSTSTFLWVLSLTTPAYAVGFLIGGPYSVGLSIGVFTIFTALVLYRFNVKRIAIREAG